MSNEVKKSNIDEKVLDDMIDYLFSEEDTVEKSIDIAADSKTKADEVVNQAPKFQSDEARGAGRSKAIHDVPMVDQDGKKDKNYDADISEQAKEEDQDEADQVKEMNQVKERKSSYEAKAPKSRPYLRKSENFTDEEYAEYLELKKAKEEAATEELKKAQLKEQEDLIKSVVEKTAARYEEKVEALQKALNEQSEIVKSMANRPQRAKSVTNIQALEKGGEAANQKPESFSKSEMLDAATELVMKCREAKSGDFRDEHVSELEMTGYIYDEQARGLLENYMRKK